MKKRIIALTLGFLFLNIPVTAGAVDTLVPVGQVVGLELENNTVTVAAFDGDSCARRAGLEIGDRLLRIDDREITCTQDVHRALNQSQGSVRIQVQRGGDISTLRVEPTITPDGPKLGVYLRQGVTGIGTVTYYDPASKTFAALGHGINDSSGQLLTLTGGHIYAARVVSVRKGRSGEPGQLMGSLPATQPLGELKRNTAQGVFGSGALAPTAQPLPVGSAETVKPGSATILSTVSGSAPREYSVEIIKIYPAARHSGRNMLLRVTDPALLEATGGIVQGMSGSPIIQDGKLIGAVTHVLVNDPTTGYGIFIENMLDAAA